MIGPIISSQTAASGQESAANTASNTELQMFNQEQQNLQPYMGLGSAAAGSLESLTGVGTSNPLSSALLAAPTMTQSQLDQTPGYQFQLSQGLKSTQNNQNAMGLGVSGSAQKAASTYATGLANSNYETQYNNAVTNQTNQYNRLMGLTDVGQSSAAGVGAAGIQTGNSIASNTMGAANAAASADITAGNSGSNALSSAYMANSLFSS